MLKPSTRALCHQGRELQTAKGCVGGTGRANLAKALRHSRESLGPYTARKLHIASAAEHLMGALEGKAGA